MNQADVKKFNFEIIRIKGKLISSAVCDLSGRFMTPLYLWSEEILLHSQFENGIQGPDIQVIQKKKKISSLQDINDQMCHKAN